jgi:hypothetical protein
MARYVKWNLKEFGCPAEISPPWLAEGEFWNGVNKINRTKLPYAAVKFRPIYSIEVSRSKRREQDRSAPSVPARVAGLFFAFKNPIFNVSSTGRKPACNNVIASVRQLPGEAIR